MGIRRRRRKLTSLMSRLEQRVRSVEMRSTNLLSNSEIQALLPVGDVPESPTSVVGPDAPGQFRRVQDAYLYTAKHAGTQQDRVEIYLEADLGAAKDEKIEVRGIHITADASLQIDVDGIFDVKHTDTPPWDNRNLPIKITPPRVKHDPTQDQLAGVTITHTYSFVPETQAPTTLSARKRLSTKRLISTYAITGTTVTITTSSDHSFKAGDVLFFDLFSSSPTAFGLDGLFKITSVTSNTLVYTIPAGVVTPVPATAPVSASYVYPVAREYLPEGSTWADSSNNKIYYWDGIRWVDFSTVADPIRDGDPPAAPTNLQVTSVPKVHGPLFNSYSEVTLTWTAPTLTEAGEPLTDLIGYVIKYRTSPTEDWKDHFLPTTSASSFVFGPNFDLEQGETYYFELYARDSGSQDSDPATATHTTQLKTGDHTTYPPTPPIATSRLGTITVTWDGFLKTGPSTTVAAPADIAVMKIYLSTTPGFTPGPTNLALSTRVFGPEGGFDVLTDLNYNTSYYIKISLVNTSGVEGPSSEQVTAQVTPLVNTDIIYSTLNTWPFVDGTVSANALANGSVTASKILGGAVQAEALANGAVTALAIASNAVTSAAIAANAVTGPAISASAITAGKIAAGAVTAVSIAAGAITSEKITAGAIGAQQIAADAITADKISAGAIGADEIAAGAIIAGKIGADAVTAATIAAGAITAGKIATNAVEADKINAGAITAVKIATNAITADKIQADAIVADKIQADAISTYIFNGREIRLSAFATNQNPKISLTKDRIAAFRANGTTSFRLTASGDFYGDDIFIDTATVSGTVTGGTFSGGTFRTAASGRRVLISAASNALIFYNDSGTEVGRLTGFSSSSLNYLTNGLHVFQVDGVAVFSISSTGIAMSTAKTFNSNLDVVGGVTTTASVVADTFVRSGAGFGSTLNTNGNITVAAFGSSTLAPNVRGANGSALAISSSDARLKTNIETIPSALETICRLNPVTFDSIVDDTDKRIPGFIAQELEEIFDDNLVIVTKIPPGTTDVPFDIEEDPLRSVEHIHLIPYLVRAIQELSGKNDELQTRIAELEER